MSVSRAVFEIFSIK